MRKLTVILAAGLVFGASGMAMATTGEGTMAVTATLTNSCSVSSATMGFGSFAALLSTGDRTADTGVTLNIACTTGTSPLIWSDTARTLSNGTDSFAFNLSQSSGAAADDLPLLSTTAEAIPSFTADGSSKLVTLYGMIPAANFSNKPVGVYTANIQVKVEY
jgi:spore coat protein U-like protein